MADKDENKNLFSQNFKMLLANNNKSRLDISKDLNISYTTICDWVNGKTIPRSKKIQKIADYFGVDVNRMYAKIIYDLDDPTDGFLLDTIRNYSSNNYQKELLIKCLDLNLDNTKKIIEQVDLYLLKQEKESEKLKWLDNYDDKHYDE